jgi:hypothetical protein
MQQSYDSFVKWKSEIESSPGRFNGNLIAVTREASVFGDILPPKTEFVGGSGQDCKARLGKVTGISDLAHGNIVALHNIAHRRFLKVNGGRVYLSSCLDDPEELSSSESNAFFLVVDLGDNRFCFYNIAHNMFLVVKSRNAIIGIHRKVNLAQSQLSDETFCDQIPSGAVLVARPKNCQGSALSLYSETCTGYITAWEHTKLDATATAVGTSELFQVVILMKIERHGGARMHRPHSVVAKQEAP